MIHGEKADEGKQETDSADSSVGQPPASPPQQPPTPPITGGASDNPHPREPILVQLIGDDDLRPFEVQTLAIARETLALSRRTYRITICAFLAALAAACFVGVQVEQMTDQTQIMGAQSESAVASGLMDQMNTRKQLDIAQDQAKAAQDSVAVIRQQFQQDQRPYIGITNTVLIDVATGKPIPAPIIGKPITVDVFFKNVGKSAALNTITHRHLLFAAKASEIRGEPSDKNRYGAILDIGIEKHMTAISVKDTYSLEGINVKSADFVNWDGSYPIFVFGRITYSDSFGTLYCKPYAEGLIPGDVVEVNTIEGHDISMLCPTGKL